MGEHGRSAAWITAMGAVLAAAVGGYFAGNSGTSVVVQLPDQQQESLGPDEAGARIERLSKDLAGAEQQISSLKSELGDGREELGVCKGELGAWKESASRTRRELLSSAPALREEEPPFRDEYPPVEERSEPASPAPVEEAPGGALQATVDDFSFELEGCENRGGSLACTFFVTNNSGDRTLQIVRGSRLVTASGTEYLAKQKELGSRKTSGTAGVELIHGIRTKGALHFSGVPPLSGQIPLVELRCWAPAGHFSVQFRDVPL